MSIEAKEVLAKFQDLAYPPTLDEAARMSVTQYFEDNNMTMVFGCAVGRGEPATTELIISHDGDCRKALEREGAVVGPYIVGQLYNPKGLGVWVPQSLKN